MNGHWHYEEAEQLVNFDENSGLTVSEAAGNAAVAQVHATLALAAAQAVANAITADRLGHSPATAYLYVGIDTTKDAS